MNDHDSALNPTIPGQQAAVAQVKTIGSNIEVEMVEEESVVKTTNSNNSKKFSMIALDLDGTLLQSNHRMADVQAEYLRRLYLEDGIRICIATGRAPHSVYEHVQQLALPDPVPVVCSNGARGFLLSFHDDDNDDNLQRLQEIFYTPVDRHVVETTIQLAKKMGYCVQYYLEDVVYANPIDDEHRQLLKVYESITDCQIQEVEDDFASLIASGGLPSKMLVRFRDNGLQEAFRAFSDAFCSTETPLATIIQGFIPRADWFLEILHPGVNKGNGLRTMCEELTISLDEVVAMGDGTNDIEFLTMAGWGVAMKNAQPSLKKVADATMEWTNDEHGVIKTIEQLRKEGRLLVSK
ncbi:HAD-like domain containing protein [Nitzschia inconspicua]|uniref:HAD-like domain containing protein n=1 Tax=Nitzschia inconspicua TaxID=303405 RepID=A0A9K3LU75_9STRA|nr:HAD-like domain containing protein [Nitzschia inconspicua]